MQKLRLPLPHLLAAAAALPGRGGVVGHDETRAQRDIEALASWRALGLGDSPEAAGRELGTLRTSLATAQARPEVPADAVVLSDPKDRERWAAFNKLGLEPADIEKERGELVQLRDKDVKRTNKDERDACAKVAGFNPEALNSIAGVDAIKFERRMEKVRDAKGVESLVEEAYITPPGENQTPVKLKEHAASAWKVMLPALTASADTSQAEPAQPGQPFVAQHSGTGGAPAATDVVASKRQSAAYSL